MAEESSEYNSVRDYLVDFQERVIERLPEEDPTRHNTQVQLLGDFVSRSDKRDISLFVRVGPNRVLRITYGLPVSEEASPLFLEGDEEPELLEHTAPIFDEMDMNPALVRQGLGLHLWAAEIDRVRIMEAAEPMKPNGQPGKRKKMLRNLLLYWRSMRRQVLQIIGQLGLRYQEDPPHYAMASSKNSDPRYRSGSSRSSSKRRSMSSKHGQTNSNRRSTRGTKRSSSRKSTNKKTSDPV